MSTVYSQAPRCRQCDEKALLARGGAQALADAAAPGMLAAYECPYNPGWHVKRIDRESQAEAE